MAYEGVRQTIDEVDAEITDAKDTLVEAAKALHRGDLSQTKDGILKASQLLQDAARALEILHRVMVV